ncbi:MAG: hypothetical protein WCF85_21970 [Rhodospirillaceae bacterium]
MRAVIPEQARTASSAFAEAMAGADPVTKADLRELEQRLTIRLGSMLIVAVGILLAAIRYLPAGH